MRSVRSVSRLGIGVGAATRIIVLGSGRPARDSITNPQRAQEVAVREVGLGGRENHRRRAFERRGVVVHAFDAEGFGEFEKIFWIAASTRSPSVVNGRTSRVPR